MHPYWWMWTLTGKLVAVRHCMVKVWHWTELCVWLIVLNPSDEICDDCSGCWDEASCTELRVGVGNWCDKWDFDMNMRSDGVDFSESWVWKREVAILCLTIGEHDSWWLHGHTTKNPQLGDFLAFITKMQRNSSKQEISVSKHCRSLGFINLNPIHVVHISWFLKHMIDDDCAVSYHEGQNIEVNSVEVGQCRFDD